MRRNDKKITERAEIDSIIRGAKICRLAFASEGEPYLVPISFGYDGRALYFHTALEGRKLEFIAANPRVCFEFEGNIELVDHPELACKWTFAFESVIGYGAMAELKEPEVKSLGLNQIMRQYSGREWPIGAKALEGTRIWRLEIESVSGKRSWTKPPEGGTS